jgi:hypothetical protein
MTAAAAAAALTHQSAMLARKNSEHTTAVKPVLPPSLIADALSTYVVSAEEPSRPPSVVPNASARNAMLLRGMSPFLLSTPAICPRLTKVMLQDNSFERLQDKQGKQGPLLLYKAGQVMAVPV